MTLDTDNDTFVDYAEFINIKMLMYNLIECSYGQFRKFIGFQRDEIVNYANITNHDNAPSFKTKVNLIVNTETNGKKRE